MEDQNSSRSQVYALYGALDSSALLCLLPEIDHWREALLGLLRRTEQSQAKGAEDDAGVHESLNEARAAWLSRDPEVAGAGVIPVIDQQRAWLNSSSEQLAASHAAEIRRVSVLLQDLFVRREVAGRILASRGLLPEGLLGPEY